MLMLLMTVQPTVCVYVKGVRSCLDVLFVKWENDKQYLQYTGRGKDTL